MRLFVEALGGVVVFKTIIRRDKNSFYVVRKIWQGLKTEEDQAMMRRIIQDNIGFINDKSLKRRCLRLLQNQPTQGAEDEDEGQLGD